MSTEDVINSCDSFRSFKMICKHDGRGPGVFHTTNLRNWQKYVDSQLKVGINLPTDLQIQLQTVKNLFLYSWFVYRFGVVAQTQAFNTLELALEMKFKKEKIPPQNSLRSKLEKALAEGWFHDGSFENNSENAAGKEISKIIIKGIASMRNTLNHGSTFLYDPLSLIETAQSCFDISNALFLPQNKTSTRLAQDT